MKDEEKKKKKEEEKKVKKAEEIVSDSDAEKLEGGVKPASESKDAVQNPEENDGGLGCNCLCP
jgi:Zn-dependent M16 (insulinase) family peptidase